MMLRKTNEELYLVELDDFIEKPSQNCNEGEFENGVNKVIVVLSKNPSAVMSIIANHPYINAIFLLDDLVAKMKKQNCVEKLGMLFDECLDELVEACIYSIRDLEMCTKAMPVYSGKVIENIISNEYRVKRILENDKNPAETLKEIGEKWPKYKDEFSECYSQYFNAALTFKG